jgi:hypothetical protein
MLEITRDLVEHYLRATGWNRLGGDPVVFRSTNAEYDIVLLSDSIQRSIQYIASASKTPRHVVAFRLGLCAAAERRFVHARFIKINNPTALPTDRVTLVHAVEQGEGEELLKCAGIEPDAWESARKR